MGKRLRYLAVGLALLSVLFAGAGCGSKPDEARPSEEAAPAAQESQPKEEATPSTESADREDTRIDRAGFDDSREEKLGPFTLQVPSYFSKESSSEGKAQLVGKDKDVFIQLVRSDDLKDHSGEEMLSTLSGKLSTGDSVSSFEALNEPTRVDGAAKETYRQSARMVTGGLEAEAEFAVVVDREINGALGMVLVQAVSSPYRYTEDFEKIVASVAVEEPPAEEEVATGTDLRPEFKEAMDSYEAFFDEYVEYMQLYQSDPTNMELLLGLSDMIAREAEMMDQFDAWQSGDLNSAEMAYYLEVQARIYKKLAEVL